LAYQWFANGKAIKGATRTSLKLKAAQQGMRIAVRVTASASGRTATTVTTKATKKVKAKPTTPKRHAAVRLKPVGRLEAGS
jgi:hypothetical protein